MGFRSLVKKFIPTELFARVEPFGHLLEAVFFNAINGFPTRDLKVIGVTGTNGKTTTCYLIHSMLNKSGYKVGMMSTVAYGVGDNIKPQMHHMTSLAVPEFMSRIKQMKKEGMEWLVLETTSHALAQNRVWGVPYSVVVLTNITHEHLAYHRTFERYQQAKLKMFKMANRNRRGLRTGIVNAEDPSAGLFLDNIKHPVSYGVKAGDIRATDVKLAKDKVSYRARVESDTYDIVCNLPGSFYVYNSLAAVGVGRAIGLSKSQIEQGIAAVKNIEGRMAQINEGQDFSVVVDYAHTPDSFEKLFKDIQPTVKGRLIVVFGSLGGGDKGKRPLQGKLAGKYADIVIVCEEDDRKEDPDIIMEDIAKGAISAGKVKQKDLFMIHDRPEAMFFAVSQAKKDDYVLFLGKGHEKTIEHADGEHPWNESEEARKALRKLKSNPK